MLDLLEVGPKIVMDAHRPSDLQGGGPLLPLALVFSIPVVIGLLVGWAALEFYKRQEEKALHARP